MAIFGRFNMNTVIIEGQTTIEIVEKLLKENPEWIPRYAKYAKGILANSDKIADKKRKFHQWTPLCLYMIVSQANGQMVFSLRYLGQDVARLNVKKTSITVSTKKFDKNNKRDFNCDIELHGQEWRSTDVRNFRKYFTSISKSHSTLGKRTDISRKKNEEHRLESLLLSEFSKQIGNQKKLVNIQPIKLASIARFQMPTPLKASNIRNLTYSSSSRGGIDILARIGKGKAVKLCIMELKDENNSKEPPTKVIQQGIAYATFIRELLRSESGPLWWKVFGFGGKLPLKLKLWVACVLPSSPSNDTSFSGQEIEIGQDTLQLHSIYFQEKDNQISQIEVF
jgi:hypothetical protein